MFFVHAIVLDGFFENEYQKGETYLIGDDENLNGNLSYSSLVSIAREKGIKEKIAYFSISIKLNGVWSNFKIKEE
ncbi:hypothetical protein [Capybara microvirus Cap1_SP_216]|nr:hypothetical protein [Capybara microvirus Cap1_SP_216]